MNSYYIGDTLAGTLTMTYNKAPKPLSAYSIEVALLNPDRTLVATVTPVAATDIVGNSCKFLFPAGQTATLTEGYYYVRARLTKTGETLTWKLVQINMVKVA